MDADSPPMPSNRLFSSLTSYVAIILIATFLYTLGTAIYNLFFNPLSKYPGPFLAHVSRFWYIYSTLQGTLPFDVQRLHEKYGDAVRIAPDELSYNTTSGWKDIYGHRSGKKEMRKEPLFYANTSGGKLSLMGTNRERHGELRRLLSHSFSAAALREQEPVIQGYADLFITKLRALCDSTDGVVDMVQWYNYFTFDVIGDLVFGEPFGCLDSSSYHPWVSLMFTNIKASAFMRSADYFPSISGLLKKFIPKEIIKSRIDHFNLTKERARSRIERKSTRTDFLVKMVEPNSGVSEAEIIANCNTLIIAGSETTATLLSGVTYLLLTHPDKLQALLQEVRSAFKSENDITFVGVNDLKYMLACLDEALRVYPPVPGQFPRRTPEEGDVINGKWVPGNTTVSMMPYATFHSQKLWTLPDEYIPERFLGDPNFSTDDKASLQPFSHGPRNCLGMNLAYVEMRVILAKLLWNFDIELTEECKNWRDGQRVYFLWDKNPLMIKLKPIAH